MADNTQKALAEKEAGNAAYKQKDFDKAIKHYDAAIELDPTNIVFYTNKSAVYFEKAEYDECIKICETGVQVGRENKAAFKLVSKAFARIGNAYFKLDNLEEAKKYFEKSLAEFRDMDIAKKVNEIEKTIKEKERLSYIDPLKADEEKAKGNEFFKTGNFPDAIKSYTEALRRNPEDHKIYSNRAACYTKLMEFSKALDDIEACIKLDPTFLKAYLRKGHCLLGMKNHSGARAAFQKALELDPNNAEASEGVKRTYQGSTNADDIKKRAMNDPELMSILNDPGMQFILQQMQEDPKSVRDHLKDDVIASKINKLMEAGLIGFR